MAIDSKEKRKSMISFGDPSNELLPDPTGQITREGEALLLKLFYRAVTFIPRDIDAVINFCTRIIDELSFSVLDTSEINVIFKEQSDAKCRN